MIKCAWVSRQAIADVKEQPPKVVCFTIFDRRMTQVETGKNWTAGKPALWTRSFDKELMGFHRFEHYFRRSKVCSVLTHCCQTRVFIYNEIRFFLLFIAIQFQAGKNFMRWQFIAPMIICLNIKTGRFLSSTGFK